MYSLGVTVCNSSHLNNHCGYLWCRTKCAYLYLGPLPLSAPSTRPTCLPSLCLLLSKALRLKVVQKKGFIEPYSSQKKRTESSLNHQQQDEMEKTNVSFWGCQGSSTQCVGRGKMDIIWKDFTLATHEGVGEGEAGRVLGQVGT